MVAGVMRGGIVRQTCISTGSAMTDRGYNAAWQEPLALLKASLIDFCDVLPVHPRHKPLESLTGYVTRLGEVNGITTVTAFASLVFPLHQRQVVYAMADLLPASLDDFSMATRCSTPELVAATFYHVARKFGRTTSPTWLGRFLSGLLAPTLRYCPDCLADGGYRSLVWRFATVRGCTRHGRYLLDRCGYCDAEIPFLASPLRVAWCPLCGEDLRRCVALRMTFDEAAWNLARMKDATALLLPHPCEQIERPATAIGTALTAARQERGLERAEVAKRLNIPEFAVHALEAPYTDKGAQSIGEVPVRIYRGTPLRRYMDYLDVLKVNMSDILGSASSLVVSPSPMPSVYRVPTTLGTGPQSHTDPGVSV